MKKETKTVKAAAKDAVKAAAVTAAKVEKSAEKAAAEVKTTAASVSSKAAEVTTKAATTTKKTVKAAETVAEKTVKAAGEAVKKAPVRKAVKETVYLQYLGKEINKDDLTAQVRDIWTGEMKQKAADLKSITLYLKPEENAAYYVINGETTGRINL